MSAPNNGLEAKRTILLASLSDLTMSDSVLLGAERMWSKQGPTFVSFVLKRVLGTGKDHAQARILHPELLGGHFEHKFRWRCGVAKLHPRQEARTLSTIRINFVHQT
ncbi:hypothetical protein HGRIS_011717 [Hohenbuehelia grisea]|uniref:Uncharacterized protein n=1 Tax=Hohenbuehelia grisea TaxID=104357 RepID=A0ABR3JWT0_9AGAR